MRLRKPWVASLILIAGVLITGGISGCGGGGNIVTFPPPSTNPSGGITVHLTADNLQFNTNRITLPAGVEITMVFDNLETALHNFAFYAVAGGADPLFRGETIGKATITYTFTTPAQPGTYYFRCDVHHAMKGELVIT